MLKNSTNKQSNLLKAILLIVLMGAHSLPALARDYKIEVLVFENLTPGRAYEPHNYIAPQRMASKAQTWKIEPSMLIDAAGAIKNASAYKLLHHYSWGQESLPSSQSAAFQISENLTNGWLKIYATQLLFANIDLDFNGYRMTEKRRLKLNEKHFFDHPKFGLLMQVSRLEPEIEVPNDEEELINNR